MDKNIIEDGIFIFHCLQLYSYEDFNKNFEMIKYHYDNMSYYGKKIYLWYIYAKDMSIKKKNMIWNKLNT